MAISNNHKLALLYMMRELLEKTDEEHTLNAAELIDILKGYGCEADRRTIYSNAEILAEFGLDVIKKEEGHIGYYVGSRDFELPELKLLVDAVQSSKFISEKKSEQLIKKLMRLTNVQKVRELNREVYIRNRIKTGNEKAFYAVDAIHEAMNADTCVLFRYGEFKVTKKLEAKKGGARYEVSPFALTWDDENYYLIAFDDVDGKIKHFRVDKMIGTAVTDKARSGREEFRDFDLAAFAKKTFGMYGGPDAKVTLRCDNSLAGVVIDRFGGEVMMIPEGKTHFKVSVIVAVSPQFFGWVTGIGPGMEIVSPGDVREQYRAYVKEILARYEDPR